MLLGLDKVSKPSTLTLTLHAPRWRVVHESDVNGAILARSWTVQLSPMR